MVLSRVFFLRQKLKLITICALYVYVLTYMPQMSQNPGPLSTSGHFTTLQYHIVFLYLPLCHLILVKRLFNLALFFKLHITILLFKTKSDKGQYFLYKSMVTL